MSDKEALALFVETLVSGGAGKEEIYTELVRKGWARNERHAKLLIHENPMASCSLAKVEDSDMPSSYSYRTKEIIDNELMHILVASRRGRLNKEDFNRLVQLCDLIGFREYQKEIARFYARKQTEVGDKPTEEGGIGLVLKIEKEIRKNGSNEHKG